MEVLLIALLSGIGFIVAYHTYGKWLGSRIFALPAEFLAFLFSIGWIASVHSDS